MKTAENGSSLCMGNYLSSYTFISLALLLNANTNESFKKKLLPNRWWYALYTYPICCPRRDKSMANVFLDKIRAKKEYKITFSLVFISLFLYLCRSASVASVFLLMMNADVLLLDKASTFFLFLQISFLLYVLNCCKYRNIHGFCHLLELQFTEITFLSRKSFFRLFLQLS